MFKDCLTSYKSTNNNINMYNLLIYIFMMTYKYNAKHSD